MFGIFLKKNNTIIRKNTLEDNRVRLLWATPRLNSRMSQYIDIQLIAIVIIFYKCGFRGVWKPLKSTLVFRSTYCLSLIYNGLYKQKLSRGVPGAYCRKAFYRESTRDSGKSLALPHTRCNFADNHIKNTYKTLFLYQLYIYIKET